MHLEIGRLLSSRTAPEELEEKIFEIVNQLNRGAALITSREERERVAELNLIAGKRAKGSTAYASALTYLAAGAALLAEDSWDRRYELAFALELHRAECEFLTGELAAAEERLSMLSRRAAEPRRRGRRHVRARGALHDPGSERPRRRGVPRLPPARRRRVVAAPDGRRRSSEEYERMWQQLGSRPIEELVDLPPMTDPACRATMDVLTTAMSPAMFTDENLLCLVVGRMANLSLEHGNSDGSCFAYVYARHGPRAALRRLSRRRSASASSASIWWRSAGCSASRPAST